MVDTKDTKKATMRASKLLALLDAASKVDPLPEIENTTATQECTEEERRDPPAPATCSYSETTATKDEWKGPSESSFPVTVMNLLDDPNNSDVLSWLPNGTGFVITDPDKFATELMPRAFQVIRFPTFLKRLERWGFAQIRRPGHPEHGAYRHPNFRRGDMATCRDGIHFSRGSGSGKFAKAVQKAANNNNNKSSSVPSSMVPALSLRDALELQLQQRQRQNHHGKQKDLFSQLQYTQRIKMQAAALQKSREAVSAAAGGSPSSSVGEAAANNKTSNSKQSHRSAHPAFALLPTISQGDVNKATKDIVAAAIASLKRDKILQLREKAMAAFLEKKKLRQQQQQQQQAENSIHQQQQQQQQTRQEPQQQKPNDISPENLNLMTSRLLSSSKCVGTHDNLAKMAKVVQLKSKISSLHQFEQLQLKEKQKQQIKMQQQQLKQQLQQQQQHQVQQQVTNKMMGAPPRVWNSAYAA